MKLVNGEALTEHTVLDEVAIASRRCLCVHVQRHDEPIMKLYLWDNVAANFCQKFKSYGRTPSVLLVTTVNPRHLGAPGTSDGVLKTGNEASGPSIGVEDSAGGKVRKASEGLGTDESKRYKGG